MTKFLATLLATSMLAMAAAPAMAMTIAEKCGPDGPEVYKRPGGFCEMVGSNDSLASERNDEPKYELPPLVSQVL